MWEVPAHSGYCFPWGRKSWGIEESRLTFFGLTMFHQSARDLKNSGYEKRFSFEGLVSIFNQHDKVKEGEISWCFIPRQRTIGNHWLLWKQKFSSAKMSPLVGCPMQSDQCWNHMHANNRNRSQPVFLIQLYLQILVTNKIKENETNVLRVRWHRRSWGKVFRASESRKRKGKWNTFVSIRNKEKKKRRRGRGRKKRGRGGKRSSWTSLEEHGS